MASNLAKVMLTTAAVVLVGGAAAVGGLHYWIHDPQWSSELIERGWIKPHAKLVKPLRDAEMNAVFAEAQATGALSTDDGREWRSDHYTDDGLFTLSNSDIELLNERYLARIEAKNASTQTQAQSQDESRAIQQANADAGWGDGTSF